MSVAISRKVWEHAKVPSTDLLVLLALADFATKDGWAWPAMETLARKTHLHERTAQRAVQRLAAAGLVAIYEGVGPYRTHKYRVTVGDRQRPTRDADDADVQVEQDRDCDAADVQVGQEPDTAPGVAERRGGGTAPPNPPLREDPSSESESSPLRSEDSDSSEASSTPTENEDDPPPASVRAFWERLHAEPGAGKKTGVVIEAFEWSFGRKVRQGGAFAAVARDVGHPRVLKAVFEAAAQDPSDPETYVLKVARGGSRPADQVAGGPTAQELAEARERDRVHAQAMAALAFGKARG